MVAYGQTEAGFHGLSIFLEATSAKYANMKPWVVSMPSHQLQDNVSGSMSAAYEHVQNNIRFTQLPYYPPQSILTQDQAKESQHPPKMHFEIITTAVLAFAPSASAVRSLEPWLINRLTTFSPPDRPGSSPWSIINITITDPNDMTATSAICATTWTFEEPPYDIVNPCSEVPGGKWTFSMLESEGSNPSPTTNFRLRFELNKEDGMFAGEESFAVGENMSGLCSAGGVCSFKLKEELAPFVVKQARVL
jgi:hypothetical protein